MNIVKYNYNLNGIFLVFSNYNRVLGNTAIMTLAFSNYNVVTGNSGSVSESDDCQGNIISKSGLCPWNQGDGIIPGYNLFLLLNILSARAILISKKIMKSGFING